MVTIATPTVHASHLMFLRSSSLNLLQGLVGGSPKQELPRHLCAMRQLLPLLNTIGLNFVNLHIQNRLLLRDPVSTYKLEHRPSDAFYFVAHYFSVA